MKSGLMAVEGAMMSRRTESGSLWVRLERLGPRLPPWLLRVWQVEHWASPKKRALPLAQSPPVGLGAGPVLGASGSAAAQGRIRRSAGMGRSLGSISE